MNTDVLLKKQQQQKHTKTTTTKTEYKKLKNQLKKYAVLVTSHSPREAASVQSHELKDALNRALTCLSEGKNQLQKIKETFWLNNSNNNNEHFWSTSTTKSKTRFLLIKAQATIILTWTHQTDTHTVQSTVCTYNETVRHFLFSVSPDIKCITHSHSRSTLLLAKEIE